MVRMDKQYYVYIMSNYTRTILYTGVTSGLALRVSQHRHGKHDGFTKKYKGKYLLWYQVFGDVREAIRREKRIKKWNRAWKERLINEMNPEWRDLSKELWG